MLQFHTTQWSAVLEAAHRSSAAGDNALAGLCQLYWYPLYAYVRRQGTSPEDAQDLTQQFFVHLLSTNLLAAADRQRGRFRTFLLAALTNFLANERRRGAALKRGGPQPTLSLDFQDGEHRYLREPAHEVTPERIFARRWALIVLDRGMARLRAEYEAAGKRPLFEALKSRLGPGDDDDQTPYGELGSSLGLSEGAVKVAVHRLRKRCRELIRDEIAATVETPREIDEELRVLFSALAV
jgi:RNA polymerase sigma-70 factor (ECF subfamily)